MRRSHLALAVISIAVLTFGCSSSPEPPGPAVAVHPAILAGTSWSVVSVAGHAPIAGLEPNVTFSQENVSGSDGCNQFRGTYRYEGATGRLEFDGSVSIAEQACARRDLASQGAFIRALFAATDASLGGQGRLILSGARGQLTLVVGQ